MKTPASTFSPFAAAVLQLAADGFTPELAAIYLGCDVELVKDALEWAKLRLGAETLEHAVALAMSRGLVV